MPRNVSNIYSIPPGTEGVPDQTIESAKYNTFIHDVETDLNLPRPIVAGGTGANSASGALTALGGEKSSQVVDNYDTYAFLPGSFSSAIGATSAPVAGHAFAGIVYTNGTDYVVQATDLTDANHWTYSRAKVGGIWGAWVNAIGDVNTGVNSKVSKAGDTMTGNLTMNYDFPFHLFNSTGGWSGLEFQFNSVQGYGISADVNFLHFEVYDAGGGWVGPAFQVARTTGLTYVREDPTAPLGVATKQYADQKVSKSGDTLMGSLNWSTSQYNAQINVRQSIKPAGIEFGHINPSGYGSVLGNEAGGGQPFLAFNCGPGTNVNTYKTLGLAGSVIRSDNAGGLQFGVIANPNADNQNFAPAVIINSSGRIEGILASGYLASAAEYVAGTNPYKPLVTKNVWDAAAVVEGGVNSGLTPALDQIINIAITFNSATSALNNPVGGKSGQTGVIYIRQPSAGGSQITTWGTDYKFSGGVKPALTTTPNAIDAIAYHFVNPGYVACTFIPDLK